MTQIRNDTYGEISQAELADLRSHALSCSKCGMLATVDPVFHAARYGHAPEVRGTAGTSLRWDTVRREWVQTS